MIPDMWMGHVVIAVANAIHRFVERSCQSGAEPAPEAQRPATPVGLLVGLVVVLVLALAWLAWALLRRPGS
jgi:hypothetical protein